jgi:hypothetical protein
MLTAMPLFPVLAPYTRALSAQYPDIRWLIGGITVTQASIKRVECFVDEFIRSEYVQNWTAENDSDFINFPERAARCYDAAEFGADGKTHAEVIDDWREAFRAMLRDRGGNHNIPERFVAAVESHFGAVEEWHDKNGSLFQEIG